MSSKKQFILSGNEIVEKLDLERCREDSPRSYPAHPSLIEWMQREGKEVVSEGEIRIHHYSNGDIVAYPLPQTEDVWLTAIKEAHRFADKDQQDNNLPDEMREESFWGYLKSNYHLTRKK